MLNITYCKWMKLKLLKNFLKYFNGKFFLFSFDIIIIWTTTFEKVAFICIDTVTQNIAKGVDRLTFTKSKALRKGLQGKWWRVYQMGIFAKLPGSGPGGLPDYVFTSCSVNYSYFRDWVSKRHRDNESNMGRCLIQLTTAHQSINQGNEI